MTNRSQVMLPGESLPYQVRPGDGVNLRNETADTMVITVKGQVSGTVVRVQLPPGGEVCATAGLENIDMQLGDGEQRPNAALAH